MNLISAYHYRALERVTEANGVRYYLCPDTGKKLFSVTTILSATGEKKQLIEWKERVGERKAEQEKQEALGLGSLMHTHLERHILGEPRPTGNNYVRLLAQRMADQIIHRGLVHVDEVWGSEVALYTPRLYAGTTDLVGRYKGEPAIMDFKTAKKLRSRDMIDDYFLQLGAYGVAHDEVYDTRIETGVIFMVSRDCKFQEFVVERQEFTDCKLRFMERLRQFRHRSPQ
jgi:genome maintenance exonuclease 1